MEGWKHAVKNKLTIVVVASIAAVLVLILAERLYERHCEWELVAALEGPPKGFPLKPSIIHQMLWKRCEYRWLDGPIPKLRVYGLMLLQLSPYDPALYQKVRCWVDSHDPYLQIQAIRYLSRAHGEPELLLFAKMWNQERMPLNVTTELTEALCRNPYLPSFLGYLKEPEPEGSKTGREDDERFRRIICWPLIMCFKSRDRASEAKVLDVITRKKTTEGMVDLGLHRLILMAIPGEYSEKLWKTIESRFPEEGRKARINAPADPFMFTTAPSDRTGRHPLSDESKNQLGPSCLLGKMHALTTGGPRMLQRFGFFMFLALLPTILFETVVLRLWMRASWKQTIPGVALGNVISAIVGVPVSWVLMIGVEYVVFMVGCCPVYTVSDTAFDGVARVIASAAALGPSLVQLGWPVPMALAVLLIPCYFLSVWIEYLVIKRRWMDIDRGRLWSGIRLAKGVAYSIMIAFFMVCMLLRF